MEDSTCTSTVYSVCFNKNLVRMIIPQQSYLMKCVRAETNENDHSKTKLRYRRSTSWILLAKLVSVPEKRGQRPLMLKPKYFSLKKSTVYITLWIFVTYLLPAEGLRRTRTDKNFVCCARVSDAHICRRHKNAQSVHVAPLQWRDDVSRIQVHNSAEMQKKIFGNAAPTRPPVARPPGLG